MTKKSPHYHVIYRACDVVKAVNGGDRPFGLSKTELVKVCFKSLFEAIKEESFQITVVGDKLSEELRAFFKTFPVDLVEGDFGASKSLLYCFELALTLPDNHWIYFCEDDYLHVQDGFREITHLINHREEIVSVRQKKIHSFLYGEVEKCDLFVHLPDYPDRYQPNHIKPSLIFIGKTRHWRQITSTTHSFICQTKSFKKRKNIFLNTKLLDKDWKMSRKIYADKFYKNKILCLSPISGLSTHMHNETMTPMVEWEGLLK